MATIVVERGRTATAFATAIIASLFLCYTARTPPNSSTPSETATPPYLGP